MIPVRELMQRAKEAFGAASLMGVLKPEGIAILMKSGLIYTGYTQPHLNAARAALGPLTQIFPSDPYAPIEVMDHFTIAAIGIVVEEKMMRIPSRLSGSNPPAYVVSAPQRITKPSNTVMSVLKEFVALQEYPEGVDGPHVYIGSSLSKEATVNKLMILDNKL